MTTKTTDKIFHRYDLEDFAARVGITPLPRAFCLMTKGGKATRNFEPHRLKDSVAAAGRTVDIYICSGSFAEGTIKDGKGRKLASVERVLFLGLDIDLKDYLKATGRDAEAEAEKDGKGSAIDGSQPFRAWPEEKRSEEIQALKAFVASTLERAGVPEPSAWEDSGGGVYPLWGLRAEDGDPKRAYELNKRLAAAVNAAAGFGLCDFKPDAGSRVYRMPGSWHLKNPAHPRHCDWMEGGTGAPIDLAVLETALAKSSASSSKAKPNRSSEPAIQLEDREVLERIRNSRQGPAFDALWRGDTSKHGDDHSAADQALCNILAFWCGRDPGQMDRLFRASGLYRDKWDRDDYREGTIQRAIDGCKEVYGSNRKNGNGSNGRRREEPPVHGDDDAPPRGDQRREEPPPHSGEDAPQEAQQPSQEQEPIHQTELGNARRLVAAYGQDLLYCYTWKSWLVWDGARWGRDEKGSVVLRMKRVVGEMYREAGQALGEAKKALEQLPLVVAGDDPDAALRDKFKARIAWAQKTIGWAMKSETKQKIEASIGLAQSEPDIPVLPGELDQNQMLLTCENGTLDLRTGKLLDHDRRHLITKSIPLKWEPDARCPEWDQFLWRVMGGKEDPARAERLTGFLRRAVGYSLTGDTSERKLFFLYGKGRNGKSTFLETILEMLGDFGQNADFASFLERQSEAIRNDLAALRGARFVYAAETKEHVSLDVGTIKNLTGRDSITARFLYQEQFTFKPEFKLWLAANHKPTIKDLTDSIWDRLMLVPFTVRIPDEEEDKGLPARLLQELPGIFQWAVRGCVEWQQQGLKPPIEVLEATSSYREEMDPVGRFLREEFITDPDRDTSRKDLYSAFEKWCEEEGIEPWKQKTVVEKVTAHGIHTTKKKGIRYWKGIRPKTLFEKEQEEAGGAAKEEDVPPTSGAYSWGSARTEESEGARGAPDPGKLFHLRARGEDFPRSAAPSAPPSCGSPSKGPGSGGHVGGHEKQTPGDVPPSGWSMDV